jgi:hypothetical protein
MNISDEGVMTFMVTVEAETVVGLTAGEMRRVGLNGIPAEVPDCAVLRMEGRQQVFRWVRLDFSIKPDGTIVTSDGTVISPKGDK